MSDLVKIQIPFSGFYNSIHGGEGGNIDQALEGGFNYDYEKDEEKEVPDIWGANYDYKAIELEYCQHFVEAFGDKYGLTLTFDEMTSPREYNFSTDRIFCKIPREEIDTIRKSVEEHKDWAQYIKDNFTSCSGFWSNYENDCKHEDWAKETLDECQYGTIIKFWLNNISPDTDSEGWDMDEYYLTNDFEMCNWDSIINAHKVIEEYLKIEVRDYVHCASCDAVIDMDNDTWEVINDNTYCTACAEKEKQ